MTKAKRGLNIIEAMDLLVCGKAYSIRRKDWRRSITIDDDEVGCLGTFLDEIKRRDGTLLRRPSYRNDVSLLINDFLANDWEEVE